MNKKIKTVLITGGSRGIGAATAKLFAKNNYQIFLNYLNNDKVAEQLKKEIEYEYNTDVILFKGDISDEKIVLDIKKYLENNNITLDVLINNAGIAIDSTLEDKTVANFQRILNVNLIGPFLTCKHLGSMMFEQKKGSIINISSTNAIDSYYPFSMDYDASKAGLNSLTHNFALLYSPHVRVNTIAPGWTNTEANKEMDEEMIKNECEHILLKRFAEPEEIAKEIYHVAESSYLNDSIIKIDGGHC